MKSPYSHQLPTLDLKKKFEKVQFSNLIAFSDLIGFNLGT